MEAAKKSQERPPCFSMVLGDCSVEALYKWLYCLERPPCFSTVLGNCSVEVLYKWLHCLENVWGNLQCSSPDSLVCTCDKDIKMVILSDKLLIITQA